MHGLTHHSASFGAADAVKETRCVIFDFDGVIADSEPLSLGTLKDTLADFGLDMPIGQVRAQFLGRSLTTIETYVAAHSPQGTAKGFGPAWQSILFARLREDVCAMAGLIALLDTLDTLRVPYCVASSSNFERLSIALDALKLTDRFPNLFSAEQVENGKPAPDLFLFAAAQMKQDPATCLVIEDSPHGIHAAAAAGMRAIGFVGGSHLRDIESEHSALLMNAGALDVLEDHTDLQELISLMPWA